MSKRLLQQLALMAAFSASMDGRCYDTGVRRSTVQYKKPRKMTPDLERRINAANERLLHDFNIKGIIIRAKDRKTALKIYNNKYHGNTTRKSC